MQHVYPFHSCGEVPIAHSRRYNSVLASLSGSNLERHRPNWACSMFRPNGDAFPRAPSYVWSSGKSVLYVRLGAGPAEDANSKIRALLRHTRTRAAAVFTDETNLHPSFVRLGKLRSVCRSRASLCHAAHGTQ